MIDQTKLDELKTKHGDLFIISKDEEEFVARVPRRPEIMHLVDKGAASGYGDMLRLAAACVVHPEGVDLQLIFDGMPGIVIPLAEKLCELAGLSKGAEAKKA